MEKPIRTPRKDASRHPLQPCLQERKPYPIVNDVRRQLGWGLVDPAHKGR